MKRVSANKSEERLLKLKGDLTKLNQQLSFVKDELSIIPKYIFEQVSLECKRLEGNFFIISKNPSLFYKILKCTVTQNEKSVTVKQDVFIVSTLEETFETKTYSFEISKLPDNLTNFLLNGNFKLQDVPEQYKKVAVKFKDEKVKMINEKIKSLEEEKKILLRTTNFL